MNNQGGRLNELDTLIMDYKDIGESSNGINKYLPKYNPKKGKNIVYDLNEVIIGVTSYLNS